MLEHVAEVVPDAGGVGRHRHGAAQQRERSGVLAALMLQHAHVVEDVRMVGEALEQRRVDHLRVVELVEPVALDRQEERLFGREAELAFGRGGIAGDIAAGVGHGGDHPPVTRRRQIPRRRRNDDGSRP